MFNHSTIGKIIRFDCNDYGFICLECGSNYRGSEKFLEHIENHYKAADAPANQCNEETILPNDCAQVARAATNGEVSTSSTTNDPPIENHTTDEVNTSANDDGNEITNVVDAMANVVGVMGIVIDPIDIIIDETAQMIDEASQMIDEMTDNTNDLSTQLYDVPNDIDEIIVEDMSEIPEEILNASNEEARVADVADEVPHQSNALPVVSEYIRGRRTPNQRKGTKTKKSNRKSVAKKATAPVKRARAPKSRRATASMDIYRCCFCSREFQKQYYLEQHNKTYHTHILRKLKLKGRLLLCLLCGEEFGKRQNEAAEMHMKEHWDEGDLES